MRRIEVLAASALLLAGLAPLTAQAQATGAGTRRTDYQRQDLAAAGWEMVQSKVELDPGVTSVVHRHPGEEIIYILEGALEYAVAGRAPVTLKAGEVLFIPAGAIHSAKNVGTGNGAELATYVVEKGKSLLEVVK